MTIGMESRNIFAIKQAEGMSEAEILAILGAKSRDNSARPMQWSAAPTPVSHQRDAPLKPAANYPEINAGRRSPTSTPVFWHHRDLIPSQGAPHLHRGLSGAAGGHFARSGPMPAAPTVQTLLVVSNSTARPAGVCTAGRAAKRGKGRLLLGNHPDSPARPVLHCAL